MKHTAPGNALVSEKAIKAARADKRNRGELERIHIEPADNGFMVTAHYEPKSSGPNAIYPEPDKTVHGSHGEASAHVASLLASHAGAEKAEKKEK